MINSDKPQFKAIMNTACVTLGKTPFDADALSLYFAILEPYTFEEVQQALFKSLTSQDSRFGITPALIVKFLGVRETRDYTWQDVIEGARNPKTPCDVLARIHIKTFYLDSYKPMEIKHRADVFLDALEDNRARAANGEYSEHEIVTMIKYGIKVSAPFMPDMPSIGQNEALRIRYNKALQSPLHMQNVAETEAKERLGLPINPQGQARVVSELKGLLSPDEEKQKQLEADEIIYNKLMNKDGE